MTNRIAFFLALSLLALFALDWFVLDRSGLIILGRKLLDLIEFVIFWR